MGHSQRIGLLAVFAVSFLGIYDWSHGNLRVYISVEAAVMLAGLSVSATWAACGGSGFRAAGKIVFGAECVGEERHAAARCFEVAGRSLHGAAAVVMMVAIVSMFEHLGSDVAEIGRSAGVSLLAVIYATFISELVLAPLHHAATQDTKWPSNMVTTSAVMILAALASVGFGAIVNHPMK